jgi:hypothetical protein
MFSWLVLHPREKPYSQMGVIMFHLPKRVLKTFKSNI